MNTLPTVLIVEDDALLQDALQIHLADKGFRTLQARDADQALALAKTEHPGVILLDLLLPGKTGMQLLEELKANHITTPVIVTTNTDAEGRRERCMELGAKAYVIKTNINLTELTELVRKQLA